METLGKFEPFDAEDDDPAELDFTEDEFDARMAGGEPVLVVGYAARRALHERVENYYTP